MHAPTIPAAAPLPQQPPPPPTADAADVADWVRRAQRGDATAFDRLIRRFERTALAIAFATNGGDASEAGDVVQEAFVRAWQRLGDLKEPAKFGPWVGGIVRNLAIDARRRAGPRAASGAMPIGEAARSPEPAEELTRRETGDRLAAALASLDEVSRSAVVLRYYEGLSSKQIGDLLDLAPTAVDMRLSRARRQLKETLGREP